MYDKHRWRNRSLYVIVSFTMSAINPATTNTDLKSRYLQQTVRGYLLFMSPKLFSWNCYQCNLLPFAISYLNDLQPLPKASLSKELVRHFYLEAGYICTRLRCLLFDHFYELHSLVVGDYYQGIIVIYWVRAQLQQSVIENAKISQVFTGNFFSSSPTITHYQSLYLPLTCSVIISHKRNVIEI